MIMDTVEVIVKNNNKKTTTTTTTSKQDMKFLVQKICIYTFTWNLTKELLHSTQCFKNMWHLWRFAHTQKMQFHVHLSLLTQPLILRLFFHILFYVTSTSRSLNKSLFKKKNKKKPHIMSSLKIASDCPFFHTHLLTRAHVCNMCVVVCLCL